VTDDESLRATVRCTPDGAEAAAACLFDLGCLGIEEPDPAPGEPGVPLVAYFPGNKRESDLAAELALALADWLDPAAGPPEVRRIPPFDWVAEVRRTFVPVPLTDTVVVAPTWDNTQYNREVTVVRIDPGQAFGTGRHQSTQLCARLLVEALGRYSGRPAPSVLDLGSGTGVLTIVAALSGAGHVVAVDHDPLAVELTKSNVRGNNVRVPVDVRLGGPGTVSEAFAVVAANLRRETFLDHRDEVRAAVAPGGTLILSGLLVHEADEVAAAFEAVGMRLVDRRDDGEWAALSLIAETSEHAA
jgi:ribosomal protein L11 methyltransferase